MMISDKSLKKIQIDLIDKKETALQGKECFKSITVMENDVINLDALLDGKNVNIFGQILKIGQKENRIYITIILYDYYQEQNVIMLYLNQITKINNINRSKDPISFSNIISPDESIILLRSNNDIFEYSSDGSTWNSISASGVSSAELLDGLFNTLKSHGMTISFTNFLDTFAQLMNTFSSENKENVTLVSREIVDLSGHKIIAGEDL